MDTMLCQWENQSRKGRVKTKDTSGHYKLLKGVSSGPCALPNILPETKVSRIADRSHGCAFVALLLFCFVFLQFLSNDSGSCPEVK